MADIFGFNKKVHGADEIVQSSGVLVSIGNNVVLAQSVNLTYQRQVSPVYELGSEDIWVQATPSSGTCEVSRAVSKDANVYQYGTDKKCSAYDITLNSSDGCTAKLDTVTASGCITTSIGLQATAGQGFLTETISAHVGMVTKGGGG